MDSGEGSADSPETRRIPSLAPCRLHCCPPKPVTSKTQCPPAPPNPAADHRHSRGFVPLQRLPHAPGPAAWTPTSGPQTLYSPSHCPAILSPWPGALSSDSITAPPPARVSPEVGVAATAWDVIHPCKRYWLSRLCLSLPPDLSPGCPPSLHREVHPGSQDTRVSPSQDCVSLPAVLSRPDLHPATPLALQDTAVAQGGHTCSRSAAPHRPMPVHTHSKTVICTCPDQMAPPRASSRGTLGPHVPKPAWLPCPRGPSRRLLTRGRQGARESRRWAGWGSHWWGALGFWGPRAPPH